MASFSFWSLIRRDDISQNRHIHMQPKGGWPLTGFCSIEFLKYHYSCIDMLNSDKDVASATVVDSHAEQEVKTSWWRRIVGFVWDSVEGEPRDRKYVQKVDAYMFTTICLGYFIKYLDQTNYSELSTCRSSIN